LLRAERFIRLYSRSIALTTLLVAAPGFVLPTPTSVSTDPAPGLSTGVVVHPFRDDTKRALIVAISDYGPPPVHPETGEELRGYRALNAANDVPLVRTALERQGFAPENIRVIQDAEADVEGIRNALKDLVRDTDEGDVVVIHYSGHGHRITNDDPDVDDEVDGYDEVLVPYGAPDDFYEGYDGELHLRDDELGAFVLELRRKVGREGNVTVLIDACHSGTATRGSGDLPARGSVSPLGPPARTAGPVDGAEDGTGIDEAALPRTRGGSDEELGSYVVFSAASQRQVAFETWDIDGKTKVGSLSYAIARTLPEAAPGTTYRTLFANITRALSGKVTQTPQMEGSIDTQVFSNRLTQQFPYVVVDSVLDGTVTLRAGTLLGLNPGTRLVVHDIGTPRPDPTSAAAVVRVVAATSSEATAEVEEGTLTGAHTEAWAFVTERTYGDLGLRVALDASLSSRDREGLSQRLTETGIIDLVDEGPDVRIRDRDGLPEALTVPDDLRIAIGAQRVVSAVEDYARNRYLRRLSFDTEDVDVVFELSPVELEEDRLGRVRCADPDWDPAAHGARSLGGDQWSLAEGDTYRLRVRNVGRRRAFVALLDLEPTGPITVLRPAEDEAPSSYELEPDAEIDLGCYQIGDAAGVEVLKLFATREPQDFRAMFETRGTRGASGGDLTELEAIVASSYASTRSSEVRQPRGTATTRSISIRIEGR
jgi:hypothetical protein